MEVEIRGERQKNQPKKVTRPFLRQQGFIAKTKATITRQEKTPIKQELEEPILELMRVVGYTDIIENVRPGEFIIQEGEKQKSIMLSPNKMTTFRYGEQYVKGWVAHEDCATPYPEDPIHTGEMMRKIVMKLAMNWRDRDEAKLLEGRGKMWLLIIAGLAIAIVLLFSSESVRQFIFGGGGKEVAQTTVEIIKENITESIGGVSVT